MFRYFFSCIIIIYVCLNTFPCVFCNTNYGIESIILADKSCNSIRFVGRKVSWQSLSHVRQHPSPSSIFVWTCEEGKKRDVKRQQHTQKQQENLQCSLSVLFPGALESNSVNSCSHCNMAAWRRLTAWHVRRKKTFRKGEFREGEGRETSLDNKRKPWSEFEMLCAVGSSHQGWSTWVENSWKGPKGYWTHRVVILQYEKQFEGFILILPANQTD